MLELTHIGSMNYDVLRGLLSSSRVLKLNRGAEIGVLYGDTSCFLLREFPALHMYCVDPYLEYQEPGSPRDARTLAAFEATARSRLAEFGERANIVKLTSLEAAKIVEDFSLDFVFIDANHEYEFVAQDIAAWFPKVRTGGMLCGHDYRWDGVNRAVNEFSNSSGINGFFTPPESDIWVFTNR